MAVFVESEEEADGNSSNDLSRIKRRKLAEDGRQDGETEARLSVTVDNCAVREHESEIQDFKRPTAFNLPSKKQNHITGPDVLPSKIEPYHDVGKTRTDSVIPPNESKRSSESTQSNVGQHFFEKFVNTAENPQKCQLSSICLSASTRPSDLHKVDEPHENPESSARTQNCVEADKKCQDEASRIVTESRELCRALPAENASQEFDQTFSTENGLLHQKVLKDQKSVEAGNKGGVLRQAQTFQAASSSDERSSEYTTGDSTDVSCKYDSKPRRKGSRKSLWTPKKPKRTDEEREVSFDINSDPSGIRRHPDHPNIKTVENPHFITVCRFLNLFPEAVDMDWTFDDLVALVETPQITEVGRKILCKLFVLAGRRLFPTADPARFCSRFWEDRVDLDIPFLFPLKKNPFKDTKWEDVKSYQRLRLLRMLVNCGLGDNQIIAKFIKGKPDFELRDGSLWYDTSGNVYWFILENRNPTVFKLYRESVENGTFELMSENKDTLEMVSATLESDPKTKELGELLGWKVQEIILCEKQRSREQRRKKTLSRQLDFSSYGVVETSARRVRNNVDYTFKEYDKKMKAAGEEDDCNEEPPQPVSTVVDRSARYAARQAKRMDTPDPELFPHSADDPPRTNNGTDENSRKSFQNSSRVTKKDTSLEGLSGCPSQQTMQDKWVQKRASEDKPSSFFNSWNQLNNIISNRVLEA